MYTVIELICTLIAVINLVTAIVTYVKSRQEGLTVRSGNYYQAFRICMTMCIVFGLILTGLMVIHTHRNDA